MLKLKDLVSQFEALPAGQNMVVASGVVGWSALTGGVSRYVHTLIDEGQAAPFYKKTEPHTFTLYLQKLKPQKRQQGHT